MSRLMSVAHTEQAVVERRKVATRRLGWLMLRPDDTLTLCRKVMGRQGAPVGRLAEVQVVDVARTQLRNQFTDHDAADEGFPDWSWDEFVAFYCDTFKVTPTTVVTYIRWRYLDGPWWCELGTRYVLVEDGTDGEAREVAARRLGCNPEQLGVTVATKAQQHRWAEFLDERALKPKGRVEAARVTTDADLRAVGALSMFDGGEA